MHIFLTGPAVMIMKAEKPSIIFDDMNLKKTNEN